MIEKLDEILLSDDVVKKFYENYEKSDFKEELLKILPEIEDCKNTKQDNPWHIYNCLDHILHSVESVNKFSKDMDENTRRILAYTMFLHDIGKPKCYIRRYSKLYKREVDSFFNHNLKSVEIAKRVLPKLNFSENEQKIIELLIKEHDIFMFISLKPTYNQHHKVLDMKLIEDKINSYDQTGNGEELLKMLLMIGRADSSAQNPEMTKSSFELLDAMDNLLNEYIEESKHEERTNL